MTTLERIQRARTLLILDHPFFGSLVMRMPMIRDDNVETLSTNGKRIRYNEEFVGTLTDPELMGVLAHEVLHVANGHAWRQGKREHDRWNKAADYAINGVLVEAGLTLPACALHSPPPTASAEAWYERLAPPPPEDGNGEPDQNSTDSPENGVGTPTADGGVQGHSPTPPNATDAVCGGSTGSVAPSPTSDPGGCGAVEAENLTDTEQADLAAEWSVAVVQAAMAAQCQGHLPAGLSRLVQTLVDPRVPWRVLLRDFVERSARNDYTWSRPNRRYAGLGVVLPSLISEELPEIVVAIDTSGSIGPAILDQFAAEVSAVLGEYDTTIHVVYCDARVAGTEVVTRADLPLKLTPQGGGGTAFAPVFSWVQGQGLTPACLIYLTDLYGSSPTQEPEYPVLWVCNHNQPRTVPFGMVATMEA